MSLNPRLEPLSRRVVAVAVAGSVVATVAVLGAVALLVESATSTPWLPADEAGLIAHCDAARQTTQREACVRAALARRDATRLAGAREFSSHAQQ
jgi:ectoine hydroxylase-related dioxygenase (phytanoyl-CoA dioxygenase family)